jgi:hypothetical protein
LEVVWILRVHLFCYQGYCTRKGRWSTSGKRGSDLKKKNQQYAPAGVPSGGTTLSAMRTPSNVYSPSSDAFGPAKTYSWVAMTSPSGLNTNLAWVTLGSSCYMKVLIEVRWRSDSETPQSSASGCWLVKWGSERRRYWRNTYPI